MFSSSLFTPGVCQVRMEPLINLFGFVSILGRCGLAAGSARYMLRKFIER